MSWDVALVKIRGDFRPIAEVDSDDYIPLGEPDAVRAAINASLPATEWSTPDAAMYTGLEYEIEFRLLASGNTVLLHVHGSGDPFPALMKLTNEHGWQAVDFATGEFLDPSAPSTEGWEGFQSLLDALSMKSPDEPSG